MLQFQKGTTADFYFTGTELATIADPFFLFIFTHRATLEKIKINITNSSTDLRADKGSIIVNDYFESATPGLWMYEVREKATGNDLTESGNIVEIGYMNLKAATAFAMTEYTEQSNEFNIYNGN